MNYKTKYRNNYRSQDPTGFKNLSGLTPTANTKKPLFFSQINPDLYFVGFEVSATEAKGNSTPNSTNPGWFVCFEERAGEIVFGADETDLNSLPSNYFNNRTLLRWDDLQWGNFYNSVSDSELKFVNTLTTILISQTNPVTSSEEKSITWGSSSADIAYALYQKPSRVFIHSNDMLY